MRQCSTSWICSFLVGITVLSTSAPAASPEAVEQSLAKSRAWLWKQYKDGQFWETVPAPKKGKDGQDPADGQFTGRTALALLALLNSGENNQDKRIKDAVAFIQKNPTTGVYALGLRCQLWLALPQTPENIAVMRSDSKILLTSVKQQGGNSKGMYDYTPDPGGKDYSHSRTQYGVLGLWAAAQANLEIPDAYWQLVEEGWKRNQDPSGGWTYKHPKDTQHPVTPGMTSVGVASLFLTQEFLRANEGINCKGNQNNPAIDRGIKWLADNIDKYATDKGFPRDYHYPTLYGFERVGMASGLRYFGTVDWYEKGSDWAIKTQKPDGSFAPDDGHFTSHISTCFAMLFLAKGRAPIVIGKLQYVDAGTNKDARWNQRPRDVANAVKWIGRQIERDLAFQIVNLDVAMEDIVESPVLSISGSEGINLSEAHRAKLKEYIEAGGTVLVNADCADTAFVSSFKKLSKDMFPDYEFGVLKDEHVINTEYYPRSKWKNKPRVESLSNGARELVILVPQADAGKAWQIQDARGKLELFELAHNVLLYAVDRQGLRNRGERYYIPPNPKLKVAKTIEVARLQYGGWWDPEPGGWRRLNNLLLKQQSISVVTKPVKLGEGQLGGVKIAHLTGTVGVNLAAAQIDELKKFIAVGGTLIVDAAGGNSEFAASIEAEIGKIMPDQKLELLPPEHPLFAAGGPKQEITFRSHARRQIGRANASRLQGITLNGRLALIYSREDLSVGLVGQSVDGILGYSPETATDLMTRILYSAAGIKASPSTAPVAKADDKKPAAKKPDDKQVDDQKADDKKANDKKADNKKPDDKKPDVKTADGTAPDDTKSDDNKPAPEKDAN